MHYRPLCEIALSGFCINIHDGVRMGKKKPAASHEFSGPIQLQCAIFTVGPASVFIIAEQYVAYRGFVGYHCRSFLLLFGRCVSRASRSEIASYPQLFKITFGSSREFGRVFKIR